MLAGQEQRARGTEARSEGAASGTVVAALSDRGAGTGVVRWAVRHPLVLCLPVQAVLLFTALGHLPVWGDEQASLERAAMPLPELAASLRTNVNPLLYFAVLRGWMALPLPLDPLVQARALSALCLMLATVAIDRCWLRGLDARSRAWFLALWTVSPAAMLYGRMARSYSLQVLLACVALYAGTRYARRPSLDGLVGYSLAATLLLYVHYVPGIAVLAAVAAVMLWRLVRERDPRRVPALGAPLVVTGLAFAPWAPAFLAALARVGTAPPPPLFGGRVADDLAAAAFSAVSFTVGESVHVWMLVAAALLAPAIALLLVRGVRQRPEWLPFVLVAAPVAFLGASRWVSYAFVAARVLFLLPFFLLLLVAGGRSAPRLRAVVGAGLLGLSLAGIQAYVATADFLNQAYVIPAADIGAYISAQSGSGPVTVILDHHSANLTPVKPGLPPGAKLIFLAGDRDAELAKQIAAEQTDGVVWLVGSAHDVSPLQLNGRVESMFVRSGFAVRHTGFAPYPALHRWVMGIAGWQQRPTFAIDVLEMRRPSAAPATAP